MTLWNQATAERLSTYTCVCCIAPEHTATLTWAVLEMSSGAGAKRLVPCALPNAASRHSTRTPASR